MKKIISTAIFIFVVLIQNLSSAADYNSINWNSAPHFNDKQTFINYIKDCENNCKTFIPVIFTDGFFVNSEEFIKIAKNAQSANITWWGKDSNHPEKVLYEINIYPGAKIAYAYLTGNTSILSDEEKKVYDIAVEIVNKAKKQPTTLRKEKYIHDEITSRVTYYNGKTNEIIPRHYSSIGALLDGRANCQGYTDSFYMLAKMLGFNVSKISGITNDEAHVWNTIEFGDGRTYGVDVTWDDASFSSVDSGEYNNYIYFNAPLEIMQTTHTWEAAYNPAIYPKIDGKYFYSTQEFWDSKGKIFGFHSQTAEDALKYIAQRISNENLQLSWGMAPYDINYADLNFSINRLASEILPKNYNWYGKIKMSVVQRGNWIFYIVEATKN